MASGQQNQALTFTLQDLTKIVIGPFNPPVMLSLGCPEVLLAKPDVY
jgi:hypothetical protein